MLLSLDSLVVWCVALFVCSSGRVELTDAERRRLLLNTSDTSGDTPLHLAARGRHTQTAALLVEMGADVNVQNKSGQAPIDLVTELVRKVLCKKSRAYVAEYAEMISPLRGEGAEGVSRDEKTARMLADELIVREEMEKKRKGKSKKSGKKKVEPHEDGQSVSVNAVGDGRNNSVQKESQKKSRTAILLDLHDAEACLKAADDASDDAQRKKANTACSLESVRRKVADLDARIKALFEERDRCVEEEEAMQREMEGIQASVGLAECEWASAVKKVTVLRASLEDVEEGSQDDHLNQDQKEKAGSMVGQPLQGKWKFSGGMSDELDTEVQKEYPGTPNSGPLKDEDVGGIQDQLHKDAQNQKAGTPKEHSHLAKGGSAEEITNPHEATVGGLEKKSKKKNKRRVAGAGAGRESSIAEGAVPKEVFRRVTIQEVNHT